MEERRVICWYAYRWRQVMAAGLIMALMVVVCASLTPRQIDAHVEHSRILHLDGDDLETVPPFSLSTQVPIITQPLSGFRHEIFITRQLSPSIFQPPETV